MALKLADSLSFGKYRGRSVRDVAVNDTGYIQFLGKDKPWMFDGEVWEVVAIPDRKLRAVRADEIVGPIIKEEDLYSSENMPFPPMCRTEDIPF